MRHNLYSCNRLHVCQNVHNNYRSYSDRAFVQRKKQEKPDLILKQKLSDTMKKYSGNAVILSEIQSKLDMYYINRAIAYEYGDKSTVRRLRAELINYLQKL